MKAAALRVLDLPLSVFSSIPLVSLSSSSGKLLAATAFGAVSLVFLARHFRRRKGRRKKAAQTQHNTRTDTYNFIALLPAAGKDVYYRDHNLNLSLNSKKDVFCHVASNSSLYSELSGSLQSLTSAKSVNACSCCSCCNGLSCWDRADASDLRNAGGLPIATPKNLHLMGMELFEEALRRWEQALTFRGTPVEDEASCDLVEIGAGDLNCVAEESVEDIITADFIQKLESLLQRAYRLKEEFEGALGMSEPSSLPSSEILPDVSVMEDTDDSCIRDSMSIASTDSFVSAAELPELRTFGHYPFYEEALQLARDGHISCRVLRTEMLDCLEDLDFLAKLYCVRQACQAILRERATRMFLAETGKKILSSIIVKARKSPKMFEEVFEEMICFLERTDHWENTEVELATRGVNHLNFYDIVLDFILMDSFEDLENPPKSIQNVINNRWLNSAFKETAVASSCWSVLKQKRQLMKVPDGFIAHFYAVCEHISPVLAWGFLGPRSPLHDFCCFFKEQVLFFLKDIFDLEKVRYTTVETLTEDVLRLLHRRSELLLAYLGADSLRRVNICTGPMPQLAHGTLLETPVQ